MNEFRNLWLENWLDPNGLFDQASSKVKKVLGRSAALAAAVVVSVAAQFTVPAPVAMASNVEAISTSHILKAGVTESLESINARIDASLANYLEDEEFSPELLALADSAILSLEGSGYVPGRLII